MHDEHGANEGESVGFQSVDGRRMSAVNCAFIAHSAHEQLVYFRRKIVE